VAVWLQIVDLDTELGLLTGLQIVVVPLFIQVRRIAKKSSRPGQSFLT
jgi:hypothetical protein